MPKSTTSAIAFETQRHASTSSAQAAGSNPDGAATPAPSAPAPPVPGAPLKAPLALIVLAFLAVYLIWGSTYLAIAYAVKAFPPFTLAGLRFVLSGALLFAFGRAYHREPLKPEHWRSAGIVGTLLLLGGNGLVCWSEQYVASGIAAVIVATVPLWFVGLDWAVFHGPPPRRATVVGIFVGIAGVALLFNPFVSSTTDSVHVGGAIALIFACMFWAGGSLYSRRAPLPKSAVLGTAMEMLTGGAALVLVGGALGEWTAIRPENFSTRAVLSFFYLVTFGSLLGFTAYVWLLKVVSPTAASTYAFVNPVVAVLLAWSVGETQITAPTAAAMGIIVAAVIIITLAPKPKRA